MRRLLWLVLLVCGCGQADTARHQDPVPMDKVPAAAMDAAVKTAKEKFPDLKFESAWKKSTGVYEIVGKTKSGKVHDIEVTEAGEVTEVE
jgi:hypothetical protein